VTAPSLVEVFNLALIRAREKGLLLSPGQDNIASTILNTSYPVQRRALLKRYRWPFAFTRVVLSPSPPAPAFGWKHRMILPADFIALVAANPDSHGSRETLTDAPETYRIENNELLADVDTMYVMYIRDETNVTRWDPLFVDLIVYKLAHDVALGLGADASLGEYFSKEADRALLAARRAAAIEQPAEVAVMPGRLETAGRRLTAPLPYVGRQ
jgi:hypothetical protein